MVAFPSQGICYVWWLWGGGICIQNILHLGLNLSSTFTRVLNVTKDLKKNRKREIPHCYLAYL